MRDPKIVVYGSSYDRGLEHLLKMWPDVIKEVPDAKLRIFYGWVLFDKVAANNPERQAWKEKMQKLMQQPGITHLGRISHGACQVEMENAGIWAYPCHFGEISCITAMRAQAFGAIPVCTDYAALDETVQHGIKVEGDIYEPEVRETFKNQLVRLLRNPKEQEVLRDPMMKWAKEHFSWVTVAKQWSEEFDSTPSLDSQVDELMENNQALDAWNLVKDTDYPKKDKVYAKVRHAFEPKEYNKFYGEDLAEHPVPEDIALDCTKLAPRFKWVVEEIKRQNPETVLDLGCADGYLCLTLAKNDIWSIGVNLYKPSVLLATKRAQETGLENAEFVHGDIFNQKSTHDAVVLFEVLEHTPYPKKMIDHCMSLVNEGGSFYISTPSPEHVGIQQHKDEPNHKKWDEDGTPSGHLKLYNEAELKELLKDYTIKQMLLDEDKCWLIEVTK